MSSGSALCSVPESGLAGASELRDALARASSLEQELHVVRGKLSTLLAAGRAACEAHMRGDPSVDPPNNPSRGGPGDAGLWCLMGALRCTEALHTKEDQGTSLAKIRMLQVG